MKCYIILLYDAKEGSLIVDYSSHRSRWWTGWGDRPVDSVERPTERLDRSTRPPMDVLPQTQSATPNPGWSPPRAAATPQVRPNRCYDFGLVKFISLVNSCKMCFSLKEAMDKYTIIEDQVLTWVISVIYFRSPSECYMKHESVKLEKQIILHGEASKCYSVEPVLRCLAGCIPVRTIPVTVGFHCLPAGKSKPLL